MKGELMKKSTIFVHLISFVKQQPDKSLLMLALIVVGLVVCMAIYFIGSQTIFAMYFVLALCSLILIGIILVVFLRVLKYMHPND